MIGEGRSINVTLIFSLSRYDQVIEAYLSGLEALAASGRDDLSRWRAWRPSSSAGWTPRWTDGSRRHRRRRLDSEPCGARPRWPRRRLAYQLFRRRFSGPRWEALAAQGARLQRPLWASTSTKNPAYPDLAYVDTLIGPDTVNTMPDGTIADFLDHGTVGPHHRHRRGPGRATHRRSRRRRDRHGRGGHNPRGRGSGLVLQVFRRAHADPLGQGQRPPRPVLSRELAPTTTSGAERPVPSRPILSRRILSRRILSRRH